MKEYFEGIKDPRQQSKVQHNFTETIMIIICAVIAGCDVWEDIEDYCRVKAEWFRERLGLELRNGIPSHDTMSRIFGMLDPKEFQARFIEWVEGTINREEREILSIDGKTMRGSRDKAKSPIHMVSACPRPWRHRWWRSPWCRRHAPATRRWTWTRRSGRRSAPRRPRR